MYNCQTLVLVFHHYFHVLRRLAFDPSLSSALTCMQLADDVVSPRVLLGCSVRNVNSPIVRLVELQMKQVGGSMRVCWSCILAFFDARTDQLLYCYFYKPQIFCLLNRLAVEVFKIVSDVSLERQELKMHRHA